MDRTGTAVMATNVMETIIIAATVRLTTRIQNAAIWTNSLTITTTCEFVVLIVLCKPQLKHRRKPHQTFLRGKYYLFDCRVP